MCVGDVFLGFRTPRVLLCRAAVAGLEEVGGIGLSLPLCRHGQSPQWVSLEPLW